MDQRSPHSPTQPPRPSPSGLEPGLEAVYQEAFERVIAALDAAADQPVALAAALANTDDPTPEVVARREAARQTAIDRVKDIQHRLRRAKTRTALEQLEAEMKTILPNYVLALASTIGGASGQRADAASHSSTQQ